MLDLRHLSDSSMRELVSSSLEDLFFRPNFRNPKDEVEARSLPAVSVPNFLAESFVVEC
jgi:hypothetical protein